MADKQITRRRFVGDSLVGAAAIGVGLSAADQAAAVEPPKSKKKILNYNPEMEYRRLGKTGLWVSAVAMGGHWKRIDKVLHATRKTFDENCHDIVRRCIEVGINYIDACNATEVQAYSKALAGRRDKMYLGLSYFAREARHNRKEEARNELGGEVEHKCTSHKGASHKGTSRIGRGIMFVGQILRLRSG